MEIQQESFQSSLNEPDSSKFRERAADIESVFEPYFRSRFPGFQGMEIEGFFNGSSGLGVRYRLTFHPSSNVSNTSIVTALQEGNNTQPLRRYTLGGNLPVRKLPPILITTPSAAPSTTPPVSGK